MNTLFWKDEQNKNPTTHEERVNKMRIEIIKEEMIDH